MNLSTSEKAGITTSPIAQPSAASLSNTHAPSAHSSLVTDELLVIIEPTSSWVALNLHDLWAYRELFYFLMWRDLKVRYKQTVLGVTWVVMQPLLTTLIFTIFLGRLARVPSGNVPYPVFAYSGLLLWTFFSGAVSITSNSLVGNAHLITKVYFPRMIIPCAAIGARLVDLAVGFAILIGMFIYYGVPIRWSMLAIPAPVLLITLLSLGVGMWASALNVKYRDVGAILPLALQLGMFVSPILYPPTLVPQAYQRIYALNPIAGIIGCFRTAVFGQQIDWFAVGVSTAFTFAFLIYAAYMFRRMEKSFADVV